MAADPADILNQALSQIGWPKAIGDLWEGSPAAKIGIQIYGQTRDELLRTAEWDFARTTAALVSSGLSVVYPYGYSYLYPTDCLYLRELIPTDPSALSFGFDVNNNPQVVRWAIAWENSTRVILTSLVNAVAIFTERVTDPTLFDPIFTETLVDLLAKKYAMALPVRDQIGPTVSKANMEEAGAMTILGGPKQG